MAHTLEELSRRIHSTEELQSVVKTMKALAAVNIQQYEKAVGSLKAYRRTLEWGLRAMLRRHPKVALRAGTAPEGRTGLVVFGSDQGMCGSFNSDVVRRAREVWETQRDRQPVILAVGERAASRLLDERLRAEHTLPLPASVQTITDSVHALLDVVDGWNTTRTVTRVILCYNERSRGASFHTRLDPLLPVDRERLEGLGAGKWPTRMIPKHTLDRNRLFSALIREYLFIAVFRAFAESLASENAARLASMQGAEKSIQEQLSELSLHYHQRRQQAITEELLDIVSGFEALTSR